MAITRDKPMLPINFQEQLAAEAAQISKRLATPSGDKIKFNGSRSIITPDEKEGTSLEVVIVDFIASNNYYEGNYDPSNIQPPACFALGTNPNTLVPSENAPNKQAASCNSCPQNMFGSDKNGKGKACKNTRVLAVMPLAMDGETPPLWTVSIPPASLKFFDAYVKELATKYKTVPLGVVTTISLDSKVAYTAPRFQLSRPLQAEEFEVYNNARKDASERLNVEPDTSQYIPIKPISSAKPQTMHN